MLQKLSENIAECLMRAATAQRLSDEATHHAAKQDYADMARRWRGLAESYQFVEGILADTAPIGSGPPVHFKIEESSLLDDLHLPAGALGRMSCRTCGR
jgi:hypothetical protein